MANLMNTMLGADNPIAQQAELRPESPKPVAPIARPIEGGFGGFGGPERPVSPVSPVRAMPNYRQAFDMRQSNPRQEELA